MGSAGPSDPRLYSSYPFRSPRSPSDGASVLVDGYGPKSRGLALAARGDKLRWYVDGQPLDEADGQVVWRPEYPGFYRVAAVDERGRQAIARVRIR